MTRDEADRPAPSAETEVEPVAPAHEHTETAPPAEPPPAPPPEVTTPAPEPPEETEPSPAPPEETETPPPEETETPPAPPETAETVPPPEPPPAPPPAEGLAPLVARSEAREAILEQSPTVVVVEPREGPAGTLVFDVPGATAFVKRPQALAESLRKTILFTTEDRAWMIRSATGVVKTPLVTCRLGDRGRRRVLECTFEAEGVRRRDALLRWVVVEVADPSGRRLYQCPLQPRQAREVAGRAVFGYLPPADEGQPLARHEPPPLELPRDCPWRESWRIASAGAAEDRPLAAGPVGFAWTAEAGGREKQVHLTVAVEPRPDAGAVLRATLDTLRPIEDVAAQASAAWHADRAVLAEGRAKLEEVETRRKELAAKLEAAPDREKPDIQRRLKEFADTAAALRARLQDVREQVARPEQTLADLMEAARLALARESPLVIRDGWGLPVATLAIEFAPCDPARLLADKKGP